MQVLMKDDSLTLRRPGLTQKGNRLFEELLLVWAPEPFPPLRELVHPAGRHVLEQPKRMATGRRLPQSPQHARHDARDGVAVSGLPEPRARLAPLNEQRSALVVAT